MRILTWNVNVLRTVLDYHPFSSLPNKSVEGLLEELKADVFCFQEHKTRRQQLGRGMACPGPYDAFWTFPRSKLGYSGVCTYVDSRVCVPLRAEEGITGLLLSERGGTMKPPWTAEEKIGCYPDMDDVEIDDEVDGTAFNPRTLDEEGRAVVLDFGMFVLFNLYCPNETNEQRRPYKMNFLRTLHARVNALVAAGRQVIVAGDINVMRAPIDSGEGGVKTTAEQHYEHPARVWLNNWCAPKGPMVDVVRESWPDREGMFTCWNQKIDARPANYGSRIDLILCTPALRPWIKGGDIQNKVYGSDHCPVYIDLHDSIELDGVTVHIRDLLNPVDRPPSTGTVFPWDEPRSAPQPPRFATKFMEEFSTKQRTLKSLWANTKPKAKVETKVEETRVQPELPKEDPPPQELSSAMGIARAAFETLDAPPDTAGPTQMIESQPTQASTFVSAPTQSTQLTQDSPPTKNTLRQMKRSGAETVDLTLEDPPPTKKVALERLERTKSAPAPKGKTKKTPAGGQAKLAAFWSMPKTKPKAKEPSPPRLPPPATGSTAKKALAIDNSLSGEDKPPDTVQDELFAQALADEDAEMEAERVRQRDARNEAAGTTWANMFAPKKAPVCTVHQHPCKDFIVKTPGPNKGKRFWLCSNFLWDSANSQREAPRRLGGSSGDGMGTGSGQCV
ncbi:hypothetical protein CcaverHIS631_0702440 [Cutaneotrichosporon cavernicola]|nr:hypothetical protein CcaverHIS631_0702440 [Cutaneotrichosporon cavernicola]